MDWIHLAQSRDNWWAPVSTVMNLRVPENPWSYLTSWIIVNFSRRALPHADILSTWLYFTECALLFESPYICLPKFGIPKTRSKFAVSSHCRQPLARVQVSWWMIQGKWTSLQQSNGWRMYGCRRFAFRILLVKGVFSLRTYKSTALNRSTGMTNGVSSVL